MTVQRTRDTRMLFSTSSPLRSKRLEISMMRSGRKVPSVSRISARPSPPANEAASGYCPQWSAGRQRVSGSEQSCRVVVGQRP